MTTHYQHTRAVVIVDSHINGRQDVSNDVIFINTNKAIKTRGRFQLHLVPRRDYLNIIHPNDVVNIYFDPGDGKRGFVRTMMGYVDRVERSETVNEDGAVSTQFTVIGSDFQKAVDSTSIYFNHFLRDRVMDVYDKISLNVRSPVMTPFGQGSSMRNAGITASGTPADFIENFLMLLLGLGQQWQLPDSYGRNRNSLSSNRMTRIQRAKDKIPSNLRSLIAQLGFNPEKLENHIDEIIAIATKGNAGTISDDKGNLSIDPAAAMRGTTGYISEFIAARTLNTSSQLLAFRSVLATTDPSFPLGILDLLDFSFIEALTVDGFVSSASVWQAGNGTVSKYLYGHCNEIVNELIFDLRPVSESEDGLSAGGYSTSPDELGVNTGVGGVPSGVKYVPAVVFREYPYSVVEGIRLENLALFPGDSESVVGAVEFGPIFAQEPNSSGRKTYEYSKPLTPDACLYPTKQKPLKHLDVVVIRNSDVKDSHLGRSDDDVYNLFSLFARNFGQMSESYRDLMSNFSPVLNPVSIIRHGLRTRELTTEFATYSRDPECGVSNKSIDNTEVRKNLVRWQLLMDHWYQHNIEYLSGSISLRAMPEIRVGYRLDWYDRNESYYVESVSNRWAYPGALETEIEVSRGQRNDPFLAYIPPPIIDQFNNFDAKASGDRGVDSRLGEFFPVMDTAATIGAVGKQGPFNGPGNDIDTRPNANKRGNAVYSGDALDTSAVPRPVVVPVVEAVPVVLESAASLFVAERYIPGSAQQIALFTSAAETASLPVGWASSSGLVNILKRESDGWVGVPNFRYGTRARDRSRWPEIWEELRRDVKSSSRNSEGKTSSATGLGQLQLANVKSFYPDGASGIGVALSEAIGMLRYIKSRYDDPDQAWAQYGTRFAGY